MPILPIDLQTLFSNLNQVSKDQAVAKEVPPEQQNLTGTQIAKTTLEKDNEVNQTRELDDGSQAIKDQESPGTQKELAKKKKKKDEEDSEKKEESDLQDPDLGQHIDIVR
jgi:hypothetical protein